MNIEGKWLNCVPVGLVRGGGGRVYIFGMVFFIVNVNSMTIYSVVTKLTGLYFVIWFG